MYHRSIIGSHVPSTVNVEICVGWYFCGFCAFDFFAKLPQEKNKTNMPL